MTACGGRAPVLVRGVVSGRHSVYYPAPIFPVKNGKARAVQRYARSKPLLISQSVTARRPAPVPAEGDAARSLRAVVLQPERSGDGGPALRGGVGAASHRAALMEALPHETTILNFRHLLERHDLGAGLFEEINAHLASRGHRLRTGTIVDTSIIETPSSTKRRRRARGHQTRKGKQWHFGMKASSTSSPTSPRLTPCVPVSSSSTSPPRTMSSCQRSGASRWPTPGLSEPPAVRSA